MWWYEYGIRGPYDDDSLIIVWVTAYDQVDADEQIRRMTEPAQYLDIQMISKSVEPPPHKRKELAETYRRLPEVEFDLEEVPF